MQKILLLGLSLALAANPGSAAADRFEDEINNYISVFQTGSPEQQILACQQLEWAGLSDHRIFDPIEKNFLEKAPSTLVDNTDLVACHAKALGFSGEEKYRAALKQVKDTARSERMSKIAAEGIALLPRYKRWNPIISDKTNFRETESLATNRIINMLKSGEVELQIVAVKIAQLGNQNPYVLDSMKDEILRSYKSISSQEHAENVVSMARIMAGTKEAKYLPVLIDVWQGSNHSYVEENVREYIKQNYGREGLLSAGSLQASAATLEEQQRAELQSYINIIKGDSLELQKRVCNILQWSGISDTGLYDLIEQKLNELLRVRLDDAGADMAAWYAKGLATSGMDKYLPALQRMNRTGQKKLTSYAQESLDRIELYKKWNPIISDGKNFRSDQPLSVNRFANMLRSEDFELKIMALKRVHYDHLYNEYLLDIIRDELMVSYKAAHTSKTKEDMFEWLTKALGGSRNKKYYDNLKEIESSLERNLLELRGNNPKKIESSLERNLRELKNRIEHALAYYEE